MNRSQCASSRRWICSSCSTYYTNGKSYSFPEPHTRTHMLEMMTKDYFSSSSSSPLTAAYSLLQLNIIILHDLQENWYCLKHLIFELHIKVDGIISCLKLKLAPSFFNLLAVHRTYMRLEYFEKMFECRKDQIIYFFNFRSPARYKYFVFI